MSFQRRHSFPWLPVSLIALGAVARVAGTADAQAPQEALHHDLWQTVQARKLLLDDPLVGPLNLGVKVTNRTAVLWGPVPSLQLSLRAEQRLRAMFELIEVRNRLTVEADDEAVAPTSPTPELPRVSPNEPPPSAPIVPRLALPQPSIGVALAGIVTPEETFTARSSPQSGYHETGAGLAAWHLPFLGGIPLPR
jgi:hypothetical protein